MRRTGLSDLHLHLRTFMERSSDYGQLFLTNDARHDLWMGSPDMTPQGLFRRHSLAFGTVWAAVDVTRLSVVSESAAQKACWVDTSHVDVR